MTHVNCDQLKSHQFHGCLVRLNWFWIWPHCMTDLFRLLIVFLDQNKFHYSIFLDFNSNVLQIKWGGGNEWCNHQINYSNCWRYLRNKGGEHATKYTEKDIIWPGQYRKWDHLRLSRGTRAVSTYLKRQNSLWQDHYRQRLESTEGEKPQNGFQLPGKQYFGWKENSLKISRLRGKKKVPYSWVPHQVYGNLTPTSDRNSLSLPF